MTQMSDALCFLCLSSTNTLPISLVIFNFFSKKAKFPTGGHRLSGRSSILGPELLRVKDLARKSNNFAIEDYKSGLKVLERIKE